MPRVQGSLVHPRAECAFKAGQRSCAALISRFDVQEWLRDWSVDMSDAHLAQQGKGFCGVLMGQHDAQEWRGGWPIHMLNEHFARHGPRIL